MKFLPYVPYQAWLLPPSGETYWGLGLATLGARGQGQRFAAANRNGRGVADAAGADAPRGMAPTGHKTGPDFQENP